MPPLTRDQQQRFTLAKLMIEVLRPVPRNDVVSMNDRLVAYCVVVSTFGPTRMGIDKITQSCGLARSTVRASLKRLVGLGIIAKLREGYVMDQNFSATATLTVEIDRKIACILAAAAEIEALSGPITPAPDMDTPEPDSYLNDVN